MQYRKNIRTGDEISAIGFGTSSLPSSDFATAVETIRYAYENKINYYDLATSKSTSFPIFAEALSDVRKNVFYQIHFGADYTKEDYAWSVDLDTVKRSLEYQLNNLKTDYIDYGFIHCLDEVSDWEQYQKNGIFDYLLDMQKQGVVKHIGLSSHTPSTAREVMKTGKIDMLMFSINPAYDYQRGAYGLGEVDERMALYRECEKEGVGISVMKAFAGGQLLENKTSPFNKALTKLQCISYALDKPGVLTVLPGYANKKDVQDILSYLEATPEEKDYSLISEFTPQSAYGNCVYCNHCQPCPAELNVGMINKYYDLAKAGDSLAREHYLTLSTHAEDCISCGHCEERCPFKVEQVKRMEEIKEYFGK